MLSENLPEALTFDDVLLVPAYSEVVPAQVSTQTQLTKEITLNTPLISSAMDTVTESRMAIAMAQLGGIGIVHRNLSIASQAGEIDKVKRSESGMIVDPVTIGPEKTVGDALAIMRRYRISGVPVTQGKRLVGILTNRDLRFETRTETLVGDLMTKDNLITVPVATTLEEAERILHQHRVEKLLVVNEQYELKGLITVKDIQKKLKYPNACKDEQGRLRVGGAIGATGDYLERAAELVRNHVDALAIDSAHGHSSRVLDAVREVKKRFGDVALLAGNVIAAGASSVMIGSLFAGVDESPGETIFYQGRSFKSYRGMGSLSAMNQGSGERYFQGSTDLAGQENGSTDVVQRERANENRLAKFVPEGIEGRVPYRGPLENMVFQLVGGLRSGMGYLGCSTIAELKEKARFVRISGAGLRESHVHDVIITREAPNYRVE